MTHWIFGYGSLIWRVDFPYLERRRASVRGWCRRFWQGSHDHRGTPDAPGRVVTLIPAEGVRCIGVAYRVQDTVFAHLDHREKNGYDRVGVVIDFDEERVPGLTYVADRDNPAFLGAAPLDDIAQHIHRSSGPSGANAEYLLELAEALRELDAEDAHVRSLAVRLRALTPNVND